MKNLLKKKREVCLILFGGFVGVVISFFLHLPVKAPKVEKIEPIEFKKEVPTPAPIIPAIPASASLVVPYSVQAPFAHWTVHDESCEEAAVYMYAEFLKGRKDDVPPAEADKAFREMKAWQVKKYGKEPDLSIKALGEFSRDYYGLKYTAIENLTVETIKKEIAAGNPVLVPVMTHSLKNPHYNVNDSYHILLIKGYDATGVITNDAGIRQGKDWKYSWEILWQAIDAQKVTNGRQGLILEK